MLQGAWARRGGTAARVAADDRVHRRAPQGADGFNGDTMGNIPREFWDAAVAVDYPLAFEPEGGGSDESLNWDTMGWRPGIA